VLDQGYHYDLSDEDAQELGRRSIYAAGHRDAFSGNTVNLYHVKEDGWQFVSWSWSWSRSDGRWDGSRADYSVFRALKIENVDINTLHYVRCLLLLFCLIARLADLLLRYRTENTAMDLASKRRRQKQRQLLQSRSRRREAGSRFECRIGSR
jgi:hypothetical protein